MKYFPPLKLNSCEQIARIIRHWLAFSWRVQSILSASERERIADLIEASEKKHTAEIAVAIEARLPWDYLKRKACARERAWNAFGKMQVWDTPQNNGVLIYLLWADKRIEIVADRSLAQVIPQTQWDVWVQCLNHHAKQHMWGEGLAQVISEIDVVLCQCFPQTAQYSDVNRASNRPGIL